jgi:hypothetical protein
MAYASILQVPVRETSNMYRWQYRKKQRLTELISFPLPYESPKNNQHRIARLLTLDTHILWGIELRQIEAFFIIDKICYQE